MLTRSQTPNLFLNSNETPGNESVDPHKYLVTLHVFSPGLPSAQLPHGTSSDMTRGSGLINPPSERRLDEDIVPRNVLLDFSYAATILAQWAPRGFKRLLEEDSNKYYPDGTVQKGEGREGKVTREYERLLKEQRDIERDARNAPQALGNAAADVDRLYDGLLWMPYICLGITPEEVEMERRAVRERIEQEEARLIEDWSRNVAESESENKSASPSCTPEPHDENDRKESE